MKCEHKEAVCVVGNFWTCKTPGCANGPKQETVLNLRTEWQQIPSAYLAAKFMETAYNQIVALHACLLEKEVFLGYLLLQGIFLGVPVYALRRTPGIQVTYDPNEIVTAAEIHFATIPKQLFWRYS